MIVRYKIFYECLFNIFLLYLLFSKNHFRFKLIYTKVKKTSNTKV